MCRDAPESKIQLLDMAKDFGGGGIFTAYAWISLSSFVKEHRSEVQLLPVGSVLDG